MAKQFIDEERGDDWMDKEALQLKKLVKGQVFTLHIIQEAKYVYLTCGVAVN